MFLEPSTALGLAELAIRDHVFDGLLKRLRLYLARGTLRVAIFGVGGVGKSTLGGFLAGDLDLTRPQPYEESVDIEEYKIGDLVAVLLVPPGQPERRTTTWPDLFAKLEGGSVAAVINVVAWGYHSFGETEPLRTNSFDLDRYLEEKRNEELRALKELAPRLRDAKKKIWMITVVTKQDLWWDERAAAKAHYERGDYDKQIREIKYERGEQNFRHEYRSVSLIMQNFTAQDGSVLKQTTAGYDQGIQCIHSNRLRRLMNSLGRR